MTCQHCSEPFTTTRSNARYCSERCRKAAWEQRNRTSVRERHRELMRSRYQADPATGAATSLEWYHAHPEVQAERYTALQDDTRAEAVHHGEPWEAHEIEIATNPAISLRQAALILGRTYAAVTGIRRRTASRIAAASGAEQESA